MNGTQHLSSQLARSRLSNPKLTGLCKLQFEDPGRLKFHEARGAGWRGLNRRSRPWRAMVDPPSAKYLAFERNVPTAQFYVCDFIWPKALVIDERI
jgi:hypothetical protein